MKIAGSQTERNLLAAFAGESQARNRYTYFAGQAKKDGFVQIAQIFEETANQEKEHAKRFFKFLEGGEVEIRAVFPAGVIGTTAENLLAAANGENEEWTKLYPQFAEVARSEGFSAVAKVLEMICVAEKQHEKRYRGLLANVESGTGEPRRFYTVLPSLGHPSRTVRPTIGAADPDGLGTQGGVQITGTAGEFVTQVVGSTPLALPVDPTASNCAPTGRGLPVSLPTFS